jgi:hypothetical protein
MLNFLKSIFFFKVGQKTSKGMARAVGLSRLATVAGLIGGWRYMRRHQYR